MVVTVKPGRHFCAIKPKALPQLICLALRRSASATLCLRYLEPHAKADYLSYSDGTANWPMARSAIDRGLPRETAPKIMIRDNDAKFCAVFKRRIRAMGIRDHPVAFRSPWQNGYVERVIGSIRRECLDHLILINEDHLHRVLSEYVNHYNNCRTHRSLAKDTPNHRRVERGGSIIVHPILCGLHHRYARI